MTATVLLKDIVEALEVQFDERPSFLDLETGRVETVSVDLLHLAEELADDEEPDLPKWQEREWQAARRIVFGFGPRCIIKLPTKFEVNEWAIMEEFSEAVASNRIRDELLRAIHGKGVFRYFNDTIRRHRIERDWFKFRAEALREIAVDWCEDHHVAWRE